MLPTRPVFVCSTCLLSPLMFVVEALWRWDCMSVCVHSAWHSAASWLCSPALPIKYIITLPRVGREKCKGQKDRRYTNACALCHPAQPRIQWNIPVTVLSINHVASCLLSTENLLLCFPSVYSSLGSHHASNCFAVFALKDVLFHSFTKSFSKANRELHWCFDIFILTLWISASGAQTEWTVLPSGDVVFSFLFVVLP